MFVQSVLAGGVAGENKEPAAAKEDMSFLQQVKLTDCDCAAEMQRTTVLSFT